MIKLPRKLPILLLTMVLAVAAGLVLRRLLRQTSYPPTRPPAPSATSTPTSTPASAPVRPSPQKSVLSGTEVMAWIYPGDPTCGAPAEYGARKIDVLKPEYFRIEEGGRLVLLTADEGCNGYSAQNAADVRAHSKQQYVTVASADSSNMDAFLDQALQDGSHINTLVSFVADNKLTGIEIDFEDFGGWSGGTYSKYKRFIKELGDSLHARGKKLMIDGPATSNRTEENWFAWRYGDFAGLPVDKIVIMAYDYQYDQGVGAAISPTAWVQSAIKWTLGRYPYKSKLAVGMPSYGYKGKVGTQSFTLLTYSQIKKEPGFATATMDGKSYEMTWKNGSYVYFYQNSHSLDKKLQAIKDAGISSVSVWHLGGNLWFN